MSGQKGKKEYTALQWAVIVGAFGSFMAAFVGGVGPWVADFLLPEKVVLQYRFSEHRVGNLSTWHLELKNSSKYAFEVSVVPPQEKVVRTSFTKPSSSQVLWSGELTKGEKVELLLVLENVTVASAPNVVPELVKVQYEDANAETGKRETRVASVEEASLVQNSRGLWRTLLIGSPFIIFGLYALRLWWLQRKDEDAVEAASISPTPR